MDHNDKLDHKTLLQSITLPSVTNDQKVVCDNDLTNKGLFDAWKRIPSNNPPGNDELTKEWYETFCDELKDSFTNSIKLAYQEKGIKHFLTASSYQNDRKQKIFIKHCWRIADQFLYLM